MNVKLIDSRSNKEYTGKLTTPIILGQNLTVAFPDGKYQFELVKVKRCLYVGKRYYIIDGNGIRFTLIFQ